MWYDLDMDGERDGEEPGVPHATITLADGAGQHLSSQETTAGGAFAFDALAPGSYRVSSRFPAGMVATTTDSWHVAVAANWTTMVRFGAWAPGGPTATPTDTPVLSRRCDLPLLLKAEAR